MAIQFTLMAMVQIHMLFRLLNYYAQCNNGGIAPSPHLAIAAALFAPYKSQFTHLNKVSILLHHYTGFTHRRISIVTLSSFVTTSFVFLSLFYFRSSLYFVTNILESMSFILVVLTIIKAWHYNLNNWSYILVQIKGWLFKDSFYF